MQPFSESPQPSGTGPVHPTDELNGTPCVLCEAISGIREVLGANDHAVAVADAYPVTRGHLLVIPRRHVADFFELDDDEVTAVFQLARLVRPITAEGWNIGVNVNPAAGQTIGHVHVHVIPRRHGDVEQPEGGVRWVIPHKARYR